MQKMLIFTHQGLIFQPRLEPANVRQLRGFIGIISMKTNHKKETQRADRPISAALVFLIWSVVTCNLTTKDI